jgi:phytoene dehydrogenase-like protein
VLSANGRVTGVASADERFTAGIVIADLMPSALARMTDFPSWYQRALKTYVTGAATVKLDWALDGPIPWANAAVGGAGTVHVAGGRDEFLRSVGQAHDGLADLPFLLLGQQSIADPTRAPAGKHTAWAYTHGPQEGVDWVASTPIVAERMEAQVERFAPGFRDRILARHVLSPADLEARNANLLGGDVGGGSYRLRQVVFRPIPKLTPYSTPIKGLFIGSAATFPGGAVHGVPGDSAARAALKA